MAINNQSVEKFVRDNLVTTHKHLSVGNGLRLQCRGGRFTWGFNGVALNDLSHPA